MIRSSYAITLARLLSLIAVGSSALAQPMSNREISKGLLRSIMWYDVEPETFHRRTPFEDGLVGMVVDPATKKPVGNGVWVSPCHFATNHHVAFRQGSIVASTTASELYMGEGDLKPGGYAEKVSGHPIAWGRFCRTSGHDSADDWAILRADKCLGAKYGWAEPAPWMPQDLLHKSFFFLNAFSMSNDGSRGILRCEGVFRGAVQSPPRAAHMCNSTRGASGTPLIGEVEGKTTLYAINSMGGSSAYHPTDPRTFNQAVPGGLFYNRFSLAMNGELSYLRQNGFTEYTPPKQVESLIMHDFTTVIVPRYEYKKCDNDDGPKN